VLARNAAAATPVGTVTATPNTKPATNPDFEAGWNIDGAKCLSATRWQQMKPHYCTIPVYSAPFYDVDSGPRVCNGSSDAKQVGGILFNESGHFNVPLDMLKQLTVVRQLQYATGTVVSSPQNLGISCGSDCSELYGPGLEVRLDVNAGSRVAVQWTGCDTVENRTCRVFMHQARTVTARLSCPPRCRDNCLDTCSGLLQSFCIAKCNAQCSGCTN